MTDDLRTRGLAVALLFLIPAAAQAQSVETRIERAAERIEQARADDVDILAPRLFERSQDRLSDARKRYDEGGRIDDIDRRIDEALAAIDEAEDLLPIGRAILGDALQARRDALEAGAPDHAESDWQRAEDSARDAGRRIESDDPAGARERAGRAETEYRRAELNAIRADVLGRARDERAAALEAKADRLSPALFSRADSLLEAAEAVLSGDRYEASEAGGLAGDAAEVYRHAARLAGLGDSVSRKRLTVEDVVLREEAQIRRIAEALRFNPMFAGGTQPVADDALVSIESLIEERDALRRDVARRVAENDRLVRGIDSLDARLAQLELREAAVSAELRDRQRRERQFREVEAIFTPSEGEVLRSEGRLILRLAGLSFPSGSVEIRPENFAVLTKVQRVIREFPEARIVVEGHTDSQGNESLNQSLSRRRAIAVREYLLANIAMSADRITAVGYGESRPVAPNDTEAGRTRNRRIEITLAFDGP